MLFYIPILVNKMETFFIIFNIIIIIIYNYTKNNIKLHISVSQISNKKESIPFFAL